MATSDDTSVDETERLNDAHADETVPLPAKQLWRPGSKLTARVEPPRFQPRTERRGDPRAIAVVILIAAAAIAVALWITALWLRASDSPPDQTEATVITLYDMTGGAKGESRA